MVLEGLAWTTRFDAVVASEGLRGKPAPDIFLAAAERIGVRPAECVAFEDAANGVQAAAAAGMTVVGVTTNVPAGALTLAGARYTIADFVSLPAELDALLPR
jgi:beta-phosphoglucomutase-like phosphatase (HAD superfamily)